MGFKGYQMVCYFLKPMFGCLFFGIVNNKIQGLNHIRRKLPLSFKGRPRHSTFRHQGIPPALQNSKGRHRSVRDPPPLRIVDLAVAGASELHLDDFAANVIFAGGPEAGDVEEVTA